MKYVLLGTLSPEWAGKQSERTSKARAKAALSHWLSGAGFRNVDVDRRLTIYPDMEVRDTSGRVLN